MTDSESNQPVERRRADPLKVAADMLADDEAQSASAATRDAGVSRDDSAPEPWHGQPASALLQLPPAGVLWLAPA